MRELDLNDTIINFFNSGRVVGLSVVPSLLMICKRHMYLLEGYCVIQEGDDNFDFVEVSKAVRENRFGHIAAQLEDALDVFEADEILEEFGNLSVQVHKFAYENIVEIYTRRYLLSQTAIELFGFDGREHLMVFNKEVRDTVYELLKVYMYLSISICVNVYL